MCLLWYPLWSTGKTQAFPVRSSWLRGNVWISQVQTELLAQATKHRDNNIVDVTSFEELKAAVAAGKWARGPWAGAALPHTHSPTHTHPLTHTPSHTFSLFHTKPPTHKAFA